MSILAEIIDHKKKEVARSRQQFSVKSLEMKPFFNRTCLSLVKSLLNTNSSGVIAEFKRKSPSKGTFKDNLKSINICPGYQQVGAAGLSILTDTEFFGGHLEDLESVRDLIGIPILRKDFIIDEYQVVEAKAAGADVVLLIAAALDVVTLKNLATFSKSLGLEVLLEVNNEKEIFDYSSEYVDLVGVNNRDLKTFRTDIKLSESLAAMIPEHFCKIAESGLSNSDAIKSLRQFGFKGFLIGESFMSKSDPVDACEKLIQELI